MPRLANIWVCAPSSTDDPPPELEYSRVLNDGLFVGRLLGVDVAPAIAVLDRLGEGRRLAPDEQRTLAAAYSEAHRRLAAAIDADGHARPDLAAPLLGSDVIASDDRGVLYLRAGRDNLIDLVDTLGRLGALFTAAEARGLAVEIEYT